MSARLLHRAHEHGVRMAARRFAAQPASRTNGGAPLVLVLRHRRRSPTTLPLSTSPTPTKLFSVPVSSSSSPSSLPPQLHHLLDLEASDPFEPPYEAIMVLGGGIEKDGSLPPWVTRRLDAAAAIREACCCRPTPPSSPSSPPMIVLLGAGTPHKPPPKDGDTGRALTESKAAARYLLSLVPPSSSLSRSSPSSSFSPSSPSSSSALPLSPSVILKEEASYDTVGNALFALTTHALPAAWTRVAVVTSAFHMPRARAIFGKTFDLASEAFRSGSSGTESATKGSRSSPEASRGAASALAPGSDVGEGDGGGSEGGRPSRHLLPPFQLSFLATSDTDDLSLDVREARAAREAASTARWISDTESIRTLGELHAWIHSEHLCYSTAKQELFGVLEAANEGMDPKALATY